MNLKATLPIDLVGAACVVALAGGVFFFGVRPHTLARAERAASVLREQTLQRVLDQARVEQRRVDEDLQKAAADIGARMIELRPVSDRNRVIAELAGVAADAGLRIDNVSPGEAHRGRLMTVTGIRLSGRGDPGAFAGYLQFLHESFPDIALRTMEVVALGQEAKDGVSFSVDLAWRADHAEAP